jgi:uncharacterized membrane protein
LRGRSCDLSLSLVLLCVLLADMTVLSPLGLEWPYWPFRAAFSAILVAFLPGFGIIGALFPRRDLEDIERLGYSIMVSLLISPLTALAMSILPSGFGMVGDPAPLLITLSALTIIASIMAYVRCKRAA